MLRKLVRLFLFMLVPLGMSSCNSSHAKDTLVVGLQSGYPPYESVNEQGKVVGFDVDLAQKIADSMGKKLVVKEMGFEALILSLKSHKIDLIMSGMSITQERLKEIDMVPYLGDGVTHLKLLFWGTEGKPISSLVGSKVAVQSGTFQEEYLHHHDGIEPKVLENTQELVMEIKYGKSAAALLEPAVAGEFTHKYVEIHSVDVPLLPEEQVLGNGIGIAKDTPWLKFVVEKEIASLKAKGQIAELRKKWFHD
jgi:arginine transport system substrate-binding protein